MVKLTLVVQLMGNTLDNQTEAQPTDGDAQGEPTEDACRFFNAFKGHGSPRRSRKVWLQGDPDVYNRIKSNELHNDIIEASRARSSQRLRLGRIARNSSLIKYYDAARASQLIGFTRISNNAFQTPAILICRNPTKVYVLYIGFDEFASFTDSAEAFNSANALKALNYDAYVK